MDDETRERLLRCARELDRDARHFERPEDISELARWAELQLETAEGWAEVEARGKLEPGWREVVKVLSIEKGDPKSELGEDWCLAWALGNDGGYSAEGDKCRDWYIATNRIRASEVGFYNWILAPDQLAKFVVEAVNAEIGLVMSTRIVNPGNIRLRGGGEELIMKLLPRALDGMTIFMNGLIGPEDVGVAVTFWPSENAVKYWRPEVDRVTGPLGTSADPDAPGIVPFDEEE